MELEHFILEEYNPSNYYHKSTVILLGNDEKVWQYLGDMDIMIEEIKNKSLENPYDRFYVVYQKGEIEPFGIIAFTFFKHDNTYSIMYGILPNYRGKKLSSVLLTEFTEYIFNQYQEIEEISLQINKRNIISMKTALHSGYTKKYGTKYVKVRNELN